MSVSLGYLLAALGLALVAGWLVGRFTGRAAARGRELAAQLEAQRKESERANAELAAARTQIERTRGELVQYQQRVSDHFAVTSDRFHELSVHYRSLFDHLSEGARALSGGRFAALEGDPAAGVLPAQTAAPEAASTGAGADSDEQTSSTI
jgi:uncharacterized membrane-anchored protein YhcB (DUF1043 family)